MDVEDVIEKRQNRILAAQNRTSKINPGVLSYEISLKELKNGEKITHWIWWIFPAFSKVRSTSKPEYSFENLEEGKRYLKHPQLSQRLEECTLVSTKHLKKGSKMSLLKLFGYTDSDKFIEVMTFFCLAAVENQNSDQFTIFGNALDAANLGELHIPTIEVIVKNENLSRYSGITSVQELYALLSDTTT
eukprot:Lithocolla_globosa_v1_NODE_7206_length_978_cov_6.542795.p1 type:complete len:189 gc:universal NODE_7206_length_978_cov_6.542795:329-895(+)